MAGTTTGGTTTYPVTIRIDEMGGLLPGMNATAAIVTESAEDVLSIPTCGPRPAATTCWSPRIPPAPPTRTPAWTASGTATSTSRWTTGVSDDDYIDITSGLQEGDTVAYDSSYSTSDASPAMYNW